MTRQNSSRIKLVALQTIGSRVVIETVIVGTVLMVSLYNDTAHTTAGGNPHIMVLVFSNTTNVVIAEALFFCQIVQTVVLQIQDIQTFTCTNPNQTSGILNDLCDEVVGKRLAVRRVTCQDLFLCRGEVEYHQSFCCSDIEVVALTILIIEKTRNIICMQFATLTGIG